MKQQGMRGFFRKDLSAMQRLGERLDAADAVVIGAGAGLSALAWITYAGERLTLEEHWAHWSRYIYVNRYMDAPKPVYQELLEAVNMRIPEELLPVCPHCGKPMTRNLRSDGRFVQDKGWYRAAERYADFLRTRREQRILFLELGVGYNTPVFRFLSTRNKLRKNTVKQQMLDISHDKTREYEERRCA